MVHRSGAGAPWPAEAWAMRGVGLWSSRCGRSVAPAWLAWRLRLRCLPRHRRLYGRNRGWLTQEQDEYGDQQAERAGQHVGGGVPVGDRAGRYRADQLGGVDRAVV